MESEPQLRCFEIKTASKRKQKTEGKLIVI